MKLWVVGKILCQSEHSWEFAGVFSSQDLAISACVEESYFVAPAVLDENITGDARPWPGAYYPRKAA